METINIQIPAPDFSFANMAKTIAKKVCEDDLDHTGLMYLENHNLTKHRELTYKLNSIFSELDTKEEQLVYLSEIITFLVNVDIKNQSKRMPENVYLAYKMKTDMAKRFFYKQASRINYKFDTNAFTNDEVSDLNKKIDAALSALDTLIMGQSALGEEIQDLKDELTSLKSSYIYGKKTWKQKATGIVVSYLANKGADAGWDAVKPFVSDFMVNHATKIIHMI
jgi:hypothetical protein